MKIPGLEPLLEDLSKRGDEMQGTLDELNSKLGNIETLLIQIEKNTRKTRSSLLS